MGTPNYPVFPSQDLEDTKRDLFADKAPRIAKKLSRFAIKAAAMHPHLLRVVFSIDIEGLAVLIKVQCLNYESVVSFDFSTGTLVDVKGEIAKAKGLIKASVVKSQLLDRGGL